MAESRALAARFTEHRRQLLRVAYRLLGSLREANVVVDRALLSLTQDDAREVDLPAESLIATVARSCLDVQRARKSRRDKAPGARLPDPLITPHDVPGTARDLGGADDVSLALLVVLETLTPAERVVYVLHDMFAVPIEQIASIVARAPTATRQLERRARGRVAGAARLLGEPARVARAPHRTVEAFLGAARKGDFDALLTVLDPDVVLRADRGAAPIGGATELRGAGLVAKQTLSFSKLTERAQLVTVNGGPGVLTWLPGGQPFAVLGFTVLRDKVVELYVFADPERLLGLDLTLLTRA